MNTVSILCSLAIVDYVIMTWVIFTCGISTKYIATGMTSVPKYSSQVQTHTHACTAHTRRARTHAHTHTHTLTAYILPMMLPVCMELMHMAVVLAWAQETPHRTQLNNLSEHVYSYMMKS